MLDTGDLVALVGVLIGTIALVHGWHLNRKLYWEPYFKKKWLALSADLAQYLKDVRIYMDGVNTHLDNWDKGILDVPRKVVTTPDYGRMSWAYDRRAKRVLVRLSRHLSILEGESQRYARLRYITTNRVREDIKLGETIERYLEVLDKEQGNTAETDRASSNVDKRKEWILHLARRYIDKETITFEDLTRMKGTLRYKYDLWVLRSRISFRRRIITNHEMAAESILDHYNTIFHD